MKQMYRIEEDPKTYSGKNLMGLGHLGSGNKEKAAFYLNAAATMDNNHQGSQIDNKLIQNKLLSDYKIIILFTRCYKTF